MNDIKEKTQKGEYTICHFHNGKRKICHPRLKRPYYLPPDEVLVRQYTEQFNNGKINQTIWTYLYQRGILECGKPSIPEARKALGPVLLPRMTKKGTVPGGL